MDGTPAARLAGILALVLAAGCARKPPPSPVPAGGRVEYAGGKPVSDLVLTFHALDEANRAGRVPAAALGKEGRFRVECLPGRYKVTLVPLPQTAGAGPAGAGGAGAGKPPPGLPGWGMLRAYQDAHTTPWEITIPEGGKSDVVLTVR